MKRKLGIGLVGIMAISALSGCGKTTSGYLLDIDYAKYVTICDYKGVEATKVIYDVTDDEVQETISDNMYDYASYDEVTDRGIEIGDCVNVDYTATLDGEVSEDYSSEDEDAVVGEGILYSEVEDALIGMKTDESKSVEVVLTDEFAEEEDVGKKMTVEVKVNDISVENLPEYNEAFVKENTDYKTMADYEKSIKEELLKEKEEEYKYVTAGEIMEYIVSNSTFDGYPEELYEQCESEYDSNNEYNAGMYGMELKEYLDFFGITDEVRKQDIEDSVNQELIIGVIAKKEGLGCTSKQIKQYAKDVYEDYGYDEVDEFMEDYSEQEIGYQIIYEEVIDFLYKNAKYNEISEEEYLEEQEAEFSDDYSDEDEEEIELDEESGEKDESEEDDATEESEEKDESEDENTTEKTKEAEENADSDK